MQMIFSLFNDIPLHGPPFQASSSPLPRIRKWSVSVTSPIVINMQTRQLLAGETKNSFV